MNFTEIYKEYYPKVFRLCMGYVNDRELAGDIAQETFIAVWQGLGKFRNQSSIGTWVFRIASNNCLRNVQRNSKLVTIQLPIQIEDKQEEGKDEKINQLYRCIAQLEEGERIIISLVLEDLPQTEIAGVVGISEGNLRVKIHRIKEKLSKLFLNNG